MSGATMSGAAVSGATIDGAPREVVTIARMAHGGAGVARLADGRVAFVTPACPEDVLEIAIVEEKAAFVHAEAVRVVEPSRLRRDPLSPFLHRCPGCVWQHMDDEAQRVAKGAIVAECLTRIGGFDLATVKVHGCEAVGEPWGYRHRVRMQVGRDASGRNGVVGFHETGSRVVERFTGCPALLPPLNELVTGLQAHIEANPDPHLTGFEVTLEPATGFALVEVNPRDGYNGDARRVAGELARAQPKVVGVKVPAPRGRDGDRTPRVFGQSRLAERIALTNGTVYSAF